MSRNRSRSALCSHGSDRTNCVTRSSLNRFLHRNSTCLAHRPPGMPAESMQEQCSKWRPIHELSVALTTSSHTSGSTDPSIARPLARAEAQTLAGPAHKAQSEYGRRGRRSAR